MQFATLDALEVNSERLIQIMTNFYITIIDSIVSRQKSSHLDSEDINGREFYGICGNFLGNV